jgi:hypothetical protein
MGDIYTAGKSKQPKKDDGKQLCSYNTGTIKDEFDNAPINQYNIIITITITIDTESPYAS